MTLLLIVNIILLCGALCSLFCFIFEIERWYDQIISLLDKVIDDLDACEKEKTELLNAAKDYIEYVERSDFIIYTNKYYIKLQEAVKKMEDKKS
jgi:hypothetical protein